MVARNEIGFDHITKSIRSNIKRRGAVRSAIVQLFLKRCVGERETTLRRPKVAYETAKAFLVFFYYFIT